MDNWKTVPGYENYLINENGEFYSKLTNKILTPDLHKNGYEYIRLYNEEGCKAIPVHRLLAICYIPNPNNLPQVNHKNGIRNENRVENLEWCDQTYNMQYKRVLKTNRAKPIKCLETGEEFVNGAHEAASVKGGDAANIRKSAVSNGYYSCKGYHYIYI